MNARCPQRYLLRELRVLRPSVVLAFGEEALVAVGEGLELAHPDRRVDWRRKWHDGYARGTIALEHGWALTILAVYHPTYGGCRQATQRMIADLRRRPLP